MTGNLLELIYSVYPLSKDCTDGHVGKPVETIESELADDRYYEIKVKRCGHCGVPLGEEYV